MTNMTLTDFLKEEQERYDAQFGKRGTEGNCDSIGRAAGCDDCSTNIEEREEHRQFLTDSHSRLIAKIREMVWPFLKSYLYTLQTDYQVHPLQAVPQVCISPEAQLRNAAAAIETKRKIEEELEELLHLLSLLPSNDKENA